MKQYLFFSALILASLPAGAQITPQMYAHDFLQQKGSTQPSRADQAYAEGQKAMDNGAWSQAVDKFTEVIRLKSRIDAAMYWKAYSLNKSGRTQEALDTTSALRKQFPASNWAKEAAKLEIEIRGPKRVAGHEDDNDENDNDSDNDGDDQDTKLIALNALAQSDDPRAIPMLEKFLSTTQSPKLRERALFVLAQSDDPKASTLINRIAKGEIYPELQLKAIHQIGIVNADEKNMQTLAQIYATTANYDVKRTILHTFGVSGETDKLMQAARTEKDPKLQRDAIHGLGISGAQKELRQLYKELPGEEAKAAVLDAFIVSGDSEGFQMIAATETNPNLRRKAIRGIGISGGKGSGATLQKIYQQNNDAETKKAALEALFISDDAQALIALAKSEKDPAMRKSIVQKLSVMGNKDANDYLIEILNK